MDDKRLMEIQGLVQGLGALPSSTSPGFENHAPHRTPLEEMGLARALNANAVRRTLAGDLVVELLGAVAVGRYAVERAARAERERDAARYQVVTLQRLFDDAAAASAKELQEARTAFEPVARFQDDALSAEDLHQIEVRLKRATGSTWTVEPHGPPSPDGRQPLALYAGRDQGRHGLRLLNLCDGDQHFEANAAFIAAAHQDVQTLLAEVHRLRGLLAAPTERPEPPEPEGWVFGPDLSRALDGKRAVGNDPLVLEVQTKISALATAERSLAQAQQHVQNLKVEAAQLMAERDRATKAADDLAYAVAPETVIGEHTNANDPWGNALEILLSRQQAPTEAPADRADQPYWVCECGLPMARNPHPDAGKPDVLLNVGATYVCIPCTVRTRHGWANQAREREIELEQAQRAHRASLDHLSDVLKQAEKILQGECAVAEARRSQTHPEIALEGRVTAASLRANTLHVRPTRPDALDVFLAARGRQRHDWERIQVRVTLQTRSGEAHLRGAASWAAQDLIAVKFSGTEAEALDEHASKIGITIGERAKVTWLPVELGASDPAAPVGGGR